jgi:hypothetical protein
MNKETGSTQDDFKKKIDEKLQTPLLFGISVLYHLPPQTQNTHKLNPTSK